MRIASDISLFWFIPIALLSIALGIWFYRNVPWLNEQPKRLRVLMTSIRSLILFLAAILLIGLILETSSFRDEKPVLITLLDNSSSMLNYKDSSSVKKNLNNYLSGLQEKFGEQFELVNMQVGTNASYGIKPEFKDSRSNLSSGFEKIYEDFYNRNVGGIVLISDGNFNEGPNPVYAAEKISLTPVFSLINGDTVKKKDQYIKNVAVNDVAFFRNQFPVEIDVEAVKFGKGSSTVSIYREGKKIADQKVNYSGNPVDFQHLNFTLEADKIGFHAYTVVVSNADNEYNYENNRRTFYIEVIDSRSRVLILAGAPHPDVSSVKQELEKDENLQVKSYIMKDWNKDLKKVDMVVIHEPGFNMDNNLLDLLMAKKIPALMIIGPNANANSIKSLGLGITIPGGKQTDENQVSLNEGFSQFEVSADLKRSMEYYPPLKARFGDLKVNGAEVLSFQRVGGVVKKDPSIFFVKKGGVKYGVIYGEGIWKWRINEYARTGEQKGFTELMSKMAQYLLVKQNTSSLRVSFPKRFTKNEEIVVNASFYNESLEPITKPDIDLTIVNDKGKKNKFKFAVSGNMYRLSMGRLDPGKYEWTASSKYGGKAHSRSGVFIVEDVDPELLVNSADPSVMRQLSAGSGGSMHELKNFDKLLSEIEKRDDITTMSYRESSFDGLIDYKWIFFLLLLLLGTEWFLRRWLGAY